MTPAMKRRRSRKQNGRLDRFHKVSAAIRSREEQLFFHPVDEDLSPGTPD
jgi:hypothetical protein